MVAAAIRPFTTRGQLAERLVGIRAGAPYVRESRTPGRGGPPLHWRDTREDLVRRAGMWRRALQSSGVTPDDRILLRLPTSWAVGGDCVMCLTDIGVLWTAADDAQDFDPTVLVTTPSDALVLSRREDFADASVRLVFTTGEPGGSIASTRRTIEERLGARLLDVYTLTEAGVVGWSCAAAPGGIHFDEDQFGVEADAAQHGELILSTLDRRAIPLERYRTGDLVRLTRAGACGCGSHWARAVGGILGRVDERVVVRGVELLPSSIEEVVRRHPAVREFAIGVFRDCELAVTVEADAAIASEGDRARVAAEVSVDLRRSLGVRLQCDIVPPGSLGDQDAGRRTRRFSRQ